MRSATCFVSSIGEPPDSWEQLQLPIPGIKPVISVRGRPVNVVRGADGAKVADIAVYRDRCMNAVEAYERGLALEACSADASHADRAGNATTT